MKSWDCNCEPISPEDLEPCFEHRLQNECDVIEFINQRLGELVPFSYEFVTIIIPTSNASLMRRITPRYAALGWKIVETEIEGHFEWRIDPPRQPRCAKFIPKPKPRWLKPTRIPECCP